MCPIPFQSMKYYNESPVLLHNHKDTFDIAKIESLLKKICRGFQFKARKHSIRSERERESRYNRMVSQDLKDLWQWRRGSNRIWIGGKKKKEKYLFDLLSDGSSQSERSPRSSCRLDSIDLENIQIIKLYDSQKQHTHTHTWRFRSYERKYINIYWVNCFPLERFCQLINSC